jgi:hypothetical protein
MATYEYKLGTTYGGMTNLEEMAKPVSAPHHTIPQYSKPTNLGSSQVRGLGWKTIVWHWDFIAQDQYDQLKSFCTGLSASVFINTRKSDGTYQTYSAIMLWPTKEPEFQNNKLMNVDIEFRALLEYTE